MAKSCKMYDPPGGWKYGFPKPYLPKPGESLRQTLIRDGYPEKEIIEEDGQVRYVRFWIGKYFGSDRLVDCDCVLMDGNCDCTDPIDNCKKYTME